jgi:hypothetical protein
MKRLLFVASFIFLLQGCDQIGEGARIKKKKDADLQFSLVKAIPFSQPCENLNGYLKLEKIEYKNKTSYYSDITTQKITRYRDSCAKSRGFLDFTEAQKFNSQGFNSFREVVKQRGFTTVKETREAMKIGFTSKSEYSRALEITPEKYTKECKVDFSACKGRKVIWYVREDSNSDATGRRLNVVDSCEDQKSWLTVDGNMDSKFIENRCSRIVAKLVKDNWLYDDISILDTLDSETETEVKNRVTAMAQLKLLEMAAKKVKLDAELELHKKDARWMASNYQARISLICAPEVEKLAKYDFEWTGGWTAQNFPNYVGKVKKPYVLTITGDAIKFQNGFGAFRKTTYYCDYNLKTDEYRVYTR